MSDTLAKMTAAQMLEAHEKFMSGAPITADEKAVADGIALAAAFGMEAFNKHPGCDGGATISMLRTFLRALVDPLHPDLDYLRISPTSGAVAREARHD